MGSLKQRSAAIGLAVALLLVTGLMSMRMAGHAMNHAHHKATTHSTAVCTWMCAAGQVLDSVAIPLQELAEPQAVADRPLPSEPDVPIRICSSPRGPPSVLS